MNEGVDVLVVGARCAGATTAMFLARAGKRVLVVDLDDMLSARRFSILKPFLAAGKRGGEIAKELAERKALAAESRAESRVSN